MSALSSNAGRRFPSGTYRNRARLEQRRVLGCRSPGRSVKCNAPRVDRSGPPRIAIQLGKELMLKRRIFVSTMLIGLLPAQAYAQSSAPVSGDQKTARTFVVGKHKQLSQALKAAKDPKTDPKLMAVLDEMLDYDSLAKSTLGKQFDGITAEQRAEFGALLKQVVRGSYRKNLRDTSVYKIEYLGEEQAKQGWLVATRATHRTKKRDKPLSVDYVVGGPADQMRVHDIVTDGVSLVRNYRRQFSRIMKRKGWAELIEMLRKRAKKLAQG